MKIKFLGLMAMAVAVAATGCRKDPLNNLTADEQRIYITHQADGVNFGNYRTFSVADQVLAIENNNSQQQRTAADAALIEAFRNGLQSRRFTPVDRNARPDLGVQISRIVRTSSGLVSVAQPWGMWDPFFWGGGFGWGPGFGGWGAPPMWGLQQVEVREGLISIDIVDLKNADTNNNLRVLWNGIVRGPALNSPNAATDIVQQLLNNSPYLQTN